jgi:hypothetical protein
MADLGYRSVEVVVTNDSRGNLTIQGVGCGSGDTWVQGETPTQGAPLNQYNSAKWGVSTNDVNGGTSGQVQLTGLGSYPLTIQFSNNSSGVSACPTSQNDVVKTLVTQQDTGEINHSLFSVQIIPL